MTEIYVKCKYSERWYFNSDLSVDYNFQCFYIKSKDREKFNVIFPGKKKYYTNSKTDMCHL